MAPATQVEQETTETAERRRSAAAAATASRFHRTSCGVCRRERVLHRDLGDYRRGYFWPAWVIGCWGIGLVLHAWETFLRRPITDADVDNEIGRQR